MAKKRKNVSQIGEWDDSLDVNPAGSAGDPFAPAESGKWTPPDDDWGDAPVPAKPPKKTGWKLIAAIGCVVIAAVLVFVFFGNDIFPPGDDPVITAAPETAGPTDTPAPAVTTEPPVTEAPAVITEPPVTETPAVFTEPPATVVPTEPPTPEMVTAEPEVHLTPFLHVTDEPVVTAVVSPVPGIGSVTPAVTSAAVVTPSVVAVGDDPGVINCSWYGEELRYFYHQLSPKEQSCFRVLYNGIMNFETEIPVESVGCTEGELERVMTVLMHDSPELFQLGNEWEYVSDGRKIISVNAKYRKSKEKYEEESDLIKDLLEEMLQDILDELLDPFDLEEAIYDWLMKNCQYEANDDGTACAEAALVYGTAQCSGYSKAFSLLLRSAGIECIEVPSVPEEDHQWNMVELDDDWYNCDPTWDDSNGDDEDGDDEVSCFCYLNLPDRRMTNHTVDPHGFVYPTCNSTEKTYARRKGIYIAPEDHIPDLAGYISEEIRRQWQEGKTSFLVMIDQDIPGLDINAICNALDLPEGILWKFVFPGKPETNSFYIQSAPGSTGAGVG